MSAGERGSHGAGSRFASGPRADPSELERLVDLSADMLCTATMSGRLLVANPAWSLTLGYPEDELIGRRVIELVHEDDRERTLEEAARLAEPGYEVRDFENRLRDRDGADHWLLWSARSDGDRLYAVARDITLRRRAEEERERSAAGFRGIFEQSLDAMLLFDDERRMIDGNAAACEFFGLSREELARHTIDDLASGEQLRTLDEVWASFVAAGRQSGDFQIALPDGRVRDVEYAASADVMPGRHLAIFRDVTERKRAHEALRASELRLRALLQTAHEGIWVVDTDDRTAFVNARMAEMLGYRLEEMLGRPLYDFLPEGARPLAREAMQARRRGTSDQHEVEFVRKDGSEMWGILAGSPFVGLEGSYAGALAMVTDITERKRHEQAVRASAERYRNIIETTSEGVWMIDADHRTTYVNRRMAEMLGYAVDEMLGRPVDSFVRSGRRDRPETGLERHGLTDQREVCLVCKDGSEIWGLLSGSPLTDGSGGYGGSLAMISDITERKRAEDALGHLAAIVDASPDAIISSSADGRVTSWNRAAERLLGYREEEILGRSAWTLVDPRHASELRALAARVLGDGGEARVQRTGCRHRDGGLVEVDASLSAIRTADGRVTGALAILRVAGRG